MMAANVSRFSKPATTWFIKYKIYHIPFWFIYHYLSWSLIVGSLSEPALKIFQGPMPIKFLFYVLFQAVGVYFNLYFLIPRFLEKGRYVTYLSLLICLIIATAVLIVPGYYITAWVSDQSFNEIFGRDPGDYMHFFKINALPSTIASMTLAMSVKLTKNWIQSRQREQVLEREKLETELKFLKSQFNPHFLFNTINSIFVLISKDPAKASDSLATFSNLLRYQLYECNEHHIPVARELSYVGNFLNLARLRLDHTVRVESNVLVPVESDLMIAPFIIMPFIENAFKHVSQQKGMSNWIDLEIMCVEDQLYCNIVNSKSKCYPASAEALPCGGIGLQNIRRRLDLLYENKHTLRIVDSPERFDVSLSLTLTRNVSTQPLIETKQTVGAWN